MTVPSSYRWRNELFFFFLKIRFYSLHVSARRNELILLAIYGWMDALMTAVVDAYGYSSLMIRRRGLTSVPHRENGLGS